MGKLDGPPLLDELLSKFASEPRNPPKMVAHRPPKVPKRCTRDPKMLQNRFPEAYEEDYKTTKLQNNQKNNKLQKYKTTRHYVMQSAGLLLGVGLVGRRGA